MIWQQPWAWLGAAAIALPVLIHLLGVGRAPRHRFPSLRFIADTRLSPTRRTQLHDPLLLLLRAAILLCAVAALAQPLMNTTSREAAFAGTLARVIVVDTSVSVQGAMARAGWPADSTRDLAASMVAEAGAGIVLETANPSDAIDGALHWLGLQPQRRELVALSDFQRGAIDAHGLRMVPAEVGITLLRVGAAPDEVTRTDTRTFGDRQVTASARLSSVENSLRTDVTWQTEGAASESSNATALVQILSDSAEAAVMRAVIQSAATMSASPSGVARDNTVARRVLLVIASYPDRGALLARAQPLRDAWMTGMVRAIRSHPLLGDAAAEVRDETRLRGAPSAVAPDSAITLLHDASGRALVHAAAAVDGDQQQLLLFVEPFVPHRLLAVLLVSVREALTTIGPDGSTSAALTALQEQESAVLPDSALAAWQRTPSDAPQPVSAATGTTDAPSDGRWLWLLALGLLAVESVVRKRVSSVVAETAS